MVDDGLLYQNGKIKITRNIFANGKGEQFVIAGIRGVRDEVKTKTILPFLAGLACLGLAALEPFFPYGRLVLGAAGAILILYYLIKKDNYVIYVVVPQGEVAAFRTSREADFRDISRSLKRAVSLHMDHQQG